MAIYGAALVALMFIAYLVNGWRTQANEYELVKPKWEAAIANRDEVIRQERANRERADLVAAETRRELDDLQNARLTDPLPAVRLCPRTPARPVPAASQAATGTAEAVEAHDPPADEGNRDIGPALDDFATDAEANLIQCQKLLEWVQSQ